MATTFFGIAVDCADAAALARFWGAVLGRQVADGATVQHAILLVSDDPASGPPVTFQQVPEAKTVKNRLHLDLITDTADADTGRLLSLGARRLRDVHGTGSSWTTFADIEGNEFDLIAG
jgi:hypothetical protein